MITVIILFHDTVAINPRGNESIHESKTHYDITINIDTGGS